MKQDLIDLLLSDINNTYPMRNFIGAFIKVGKVLRMGITYSYILQADKITYRRTDKSDYANMFGTVIFKNLIAIDIVNIT